MQDSKKAMNLNIGTTIKTIRKSLNMTQKELADKLNISAQQIHKYESGVDDISLNKVYQIAKIFHCDVSILIGNNYNNDKKNLMVAEKKYELDYFENIKNSNNNTSNDNDNAVFLLKKYFSLKKNDRLKVIDFLNNITKK